MSSSLQTLAVTLTAVFILSNAAALIGGRPNAERTRRSIPWLQRSTSLQLAVLAWLFFLMGGRGTPLAAWTLGIAIGMSLSFVADLIMAQMIPLPNHVLAGMVVFGLAHTAYITAYLVGGQALDLLPRSPLLVSITLFMGLAVLVWWRFVYHPKTPRPLTLGALGYLVFLASMTGVAVALSIAEPRLWLVGLGAVLFLISDSILGNQLFRHNHWPYVSEAVWLTYIAGQAGIVWASGLALTL
jgi:hypothetical protein